MFYVKNEIGEGVTLLTEINSENVYTVCPECGVEHMVDLVDILTTSDADLYSTQVFCHDCSKKRAQQHRGEPWAEMVIADCLAQKKSFSCKQGT